MSTELNEIILKEAKEDMVLVSYPTDESNKEIETIKSEHGKCGTEKNNN